MSRSWLVASVACFCLSSAATATELPHVDAPPPAPVITPDNAPPPPPPGQIKFVRQGQSTLLMGKDPVTMEPELSPTQSPSASQSPAANNNPSQAPIAGTTETPATLPPPPQLNAVPPLPPSQSGAATPPAVPAQQNMNNTPNLPPAQSGAATPPANPAPQAMSGQPQAPARQPALQRGGSNPLKCYCYAPGIEPYGDGTRCRPGTRSSCGALHTQKERIGMSYQNQPARTDIAPPPVTAPGTGGCACVGPGIEPYGNGKDCRAGTHSTCPSQSKEFTLEQPPATEGERLQKGGKNIGADPEDKGPRGLSSHVVHKPMPNGSGAVASPFPPED